MLCFQIGFVLTLADIRSSWRHIKKYWLILEKSEFERGIALDFNYSVGVTSKNEKLKTNVGFLLHVVFSCLFLSSCW